MFFLQKYFGNVNNQNITAFFKIIPVLLRFSNKFLHLCSIFCDAIVVKEDGDIVCYHFYDRNQLENYLYDNTAFDTPSTSRHEFFQIWRGEDNNVYLKLKGLYFAIQPLQNKYKIPFKNSPCGFS